MGVSTIHPVTLARSYAEITQTELGLRMGRKQSFVARLEKGDYDYVQYAGALAEATGLPIQFFDPSHKWIAPDSAISFRKRTKCPSRLRDKAMFYAVIAHHSMAQMVGSIVKYPEPSIPFHPVENASDTVSARMMGAAVASMVRSEWGIGWGPISDSIRLLESKGVRVFYVREDSDFMDGFACWTEGIPYVFLNSNVSDPARTRLDVSHELGHLVMHRDIAYDARTDIIESMAFGFGTEFLAPWVTLSREVPANTDIHKLGRLRGRWRISMQAIVKHMHSNRHISDAMYANAFRRFAFLGYRGAAEPGWIVPDSSIIHAKFLEIIEAKGLSVATIAEQFGIPEKLLGDMIPESRNLRAFDPFANASEKPF